MTTNNSCHSNATAYEPDGTVIALHCSAGNAKQWRTLAEKLNGIYEFHAPEHYGTQNNRRWSKKQKFTLVDEASLSIALIDQTDDPIHLVGHSYGGALALHIAVARPHRIASISLYEPCAFHILQQPGGRGPGALREISRLAEKIRHLISRGLQEKAMQLFVDYWNGKGSWQRLKPEQQSYLVNWAPNAVNAFYALFGEETALPCYRSLDCPVLLIQGDLSPSPTHAVNQALHEFIPGSQLVQLTGLGHMGPITHAEQIAETLYKHITARPTAHNTQSGHSQRIRPMEQIAA